jgi:hypothetical protein
LENLISFEQSIGESSGNPKFFRFFIHAVVGLGEDLF